jgi:hypothetical protein
VRLTLYPDPGRRDVVARVTVVGAEQPSSTELAWSAAIDRRHSHRAPFDLLGISWRDRAAMVSAVGGDGVTARVLRREESVGLADLLGYANLAYRRDIAYQRELNEWLPGFPGRVRERSTPPWNGLARPDTAVPDRFVLADRLRRECVLFVLTNGDRHRDHLLAGMAMQRAWLTAVSRRLVASVLTQPWHLPEVRTSLTTLLGCGDTPQLMLRVGRPTGTTDSSPDNGRT